MSIEYKKIVVSNDYLNELYNLSKEWYLEKSCPSYSVNNPNYYLDKEIFIALLNNKIIGYSLGKIKELKSKTSYNCIGDKAFELDEMYVSKQYRNKGIGKSLFKFIENYYNNEIDVIKLIATSYEYEKLLKFYIEELGLDFNHALLVKRLKKSI